ncbi:hypothetical protein Nepgr_017495 [Nepenthes gracilis]|uniref:Uncharacterized protein n=1 Tax=Nepenthes gracilis TaxID=150966 RepID=A0AAD3SRQ4_NEPGR|nr:hypothetical protein Nepgr_017495 [Nepenthes gracilis]
MKYTDSRRSSDSVLCNTNRSKSPPVLAVLSVLLLHHFRYSDQPRSLPPPPENPLTTTDIRWPSALLCRAVQNLSSASICSAG